MTPWLADHLVCPRDRTDLHRTADELACAADHRYRVYDGIPIMLVDDVEPTHGYIDQTLRQLADPASGAPRTDGARINGVDSYVQAEVPYSSGTLYLGIQHRLPRYPIPAWRWSTGSGERLLDVGCNWGRWSISAARAGFHPVGIDPSLDAVLAARRVAAQLGVEADHVVGDARFLPFREHSFDRVFSYSVLQHFSKDDARQALAQFRRVLTANGRTLVQMPSRRGIRQYQQHRRRGFSDGEGFDVRYWTPAELAATFDELVGPSTLSPDCYFGLGIQGSDADLLPLRSRIIVHASEGIRWLSRWITPLRARADSVYVESVPSAVR